MHVIVQKEFASLKLSEKIHGKKHNMLSIPNFIFIFLEKDEKDGEYFLKKKSLDFVGISQAVDENEGK
jgi:hypothetical protein